MRRLILMIGCLLLLAHAAWAADRVRYVDTGSAGGNGTTAATSGENAAYVSLDACLDAELAADAVLTDEGLLVTHLNRTNGGGTDTTAGATSNGWTVNETCYIKFVQDDFPGDGVFDDTKYVLDITNATGLLLSDGYEHIDGLQVRMNNTAGTGVMGINVASLTARPVYLNRVIIVGGSLAAQNGSNAYGLYVNDADVTVNVSNSIISGFVAGGTSVRRAMHVNDSTAVNVYHAVLTGSASGIYQSAGTVTVTNSTLFNNTDDWGGTITATYCASDDADATTYTNGIDWTAEATDWVAAMPDYATGDYAITAASVLYNAGVSLAGTVDADILDVERPQGGAYDIGAFEFSSGGGGSIGPIQNYLRILLENNQ